MAVATKVTKKVYISGSAYTLTVGRLSGGKIPVTIHVDGTKDSSRVKYRVSLERTGAIISSQPRTGTAWPQSLRSFSFTNVVNKGKLAVIFNLNKQGGSGGGRSIGVTVLQ